jgi:hypothetical protein
MKLSLGLMDDGEEGEEVLAGASVESEGWLAWRLSGVVQVKRLG